MPITKIERQAIDKLIHAGKLMSHRLYEVATREEAGDEDKAMLRFIDQWDAATANVRAIAKAEPEPKKSERVPSLRATSPE